MSGASTLRASIRRAAVPLTGGAGDYDALVDLAKGARLVLLGEASHGTHEFYRERARITRRLIEDEGFTIVAAEADWPDAYRVNRFVRGMGDDTAAADALADFRRFPAWMWRNADVLDFVGWRRLERAIGVIYLPRTERVSHYFHASLPAQFDAVIHVDETRAVVPLEQSAGWDAGEPPETYPWAV